MIRKIDYFDSYKDNGGKLFVAVVETFIVGKALAPTRQNCTWLFVSLWLISIIHRILFGHYTYCSK